VVAGAGWPALAAREVVFLLARVGHPGSLTPAAYTVLDLAEWTTDQRLAPRRAGCPVCCPPAPGDLPVAGIDGYPLAYTYEQAVTFPVDELSDPKIHQQHYRVANIELQAEHRSYDSAPRLPLPQVDLAALGTAVPAPPPERLAAVLLASFGLRTGSGGREIRRYAPTGGNLGSPQAYVLVRDIAGIPPGLYFYESPSHELSLLRDSDAVAGLGEDLAGGPDAAAVVVVTALVGRIARKYQLLALRVCCLDSGVALHQVRAVCGEVGFGCELLDDWDDEKTSDALTTDRRGEPVLGIAVITDQGSRK
jgi:SagB-type dehydrogenase family enzyme